MEMNQMMQRIDEECNGNVYLADMLKNLFRLEKNMPGRYKKKYDDIITEQAKKGEDEDAD